MRKCKITVFDYSDARHNSPATWYDKDNPPEVVEYNVEAWCAGGDEGVQAYWVQDRVLYIAHGDDGHWWLNSTIAVNWAAEIIAAIEKAVKE